LDLYDGRKIQIAEGAGSYREHRLSSADVLVMPEYLGLALADANIELPMVIFNQGWSPTFRGYGFGECASRTPYARPNVLAAVAVSEYVRRYLEYAFEGLNVLRVVNGVDPSLFHPNSMPRYRRIAFMPRRMERHIEQVINMLVLRGALDGWELAPIVGLPESGVAEILRHSFVYLSTCEEEGFGLPPLEAGMAGCIVVGYTGSGADEYFHDGLCERVDQDDVLGFAQAVERTLAWVEANEAKAIERGRAFSEFLNDRYSLEREAESVIRAWRTILANA
jgi:glycosyltransferase involved in cell wall biosynthesis